MVACAMSANSMVPYLTDWCSVCGAYTSHHHCGVCEAYRRYFGRSYPGHHHTDCCNCYCPVRRAATRALMPNSVQRYWRSRDSKLQDAA